MMPPCFPNLLPAGRPLPCPFPLPSRPGRGSGGSEPVTKGEYNGRWVGKRRGGAVLDPVGVMAEDVDGGVDLGPDALAAGGFEFSLRICRRVRRTSWGYVASDATILENALQTRMVEGGRDE